jgi:steroid C-25 hydroxylase gamma subunit
MTATITAASLTAAQVKALRPWSAGWPEPVEVKLGPAPLEAQPSAYVQAVWKDRPYGTTPSARVSAATDGGALFLRLEWASESPRLAITDNNVFADACGALFPANGKSATLETMGDEAEPVISWYWRAGTETPFVGDATGLGTVARRSAHALSAAAELASGKWAVVFRHPLAEQGLKATPGASIPAAFAVWSGSMNERAGLAAFSPEWLAIAIPGGQRGAAR